MHEDGVYWPNGAIWLAAEYRGDLDALVAALQGLSVRGYAIGSSYGLSGWMLAGSCERVARGERATVA